MAFITPNLSPEPHFQVWNEEAWGHFVSEMPDQYDSEKWDGFHYEQARLDGRVQAEISDEMASIAAASRKVDEWNAASKLAAEARKVKAVRVRSKPTVEPQIHLCRVQGCEGRYTRKPELRTHITNVHGSEHLEDLRLPSKEEKRHPCPHLDCESGFLRPADLKKHRIEKHGELLERRKRIPDSKKNFICQTCQKKYAHKKKLTGHIRSKHQ